MTVFFPSNQITIYRQQRIGINHRFAMSATFTSYPADIQPAGRERTEMAEARFGKAYVAFIDANIDIKEGDQLRVSDQTQKYGVKGVSRWQGAGILDHIELLLVAQD